ncbi:MAG: hypothetical protein KF843_13085 [Flavobacteriales bacterium]|nr:hypothetical protein [Flavobacteriales bacterium]
MPFPEDSSIAGAATGSLATGSLELEQEASSTAAAKAMAAKEDAVVVM